MPDDAAATARGGGRGETTVRELSRIEQTVARRTAESKATIPHLVLEAEVDMEACAELVAGVGEDGPSYDDLVVKAAALALREHPRANGSYRDGRLELHGRINVGVAVHGGDGVVVPTVFDADARPLDDLARVVRELTERVRAGTIRAPEQSAGTFTVSSLGTHGVRRFTAVVVPPQVAALAVGEVAPRPVARAGAVEARRTVTLTLSCDHRALYGADAAAFLGRIRALLEDPGALG